MLKRTNLLKDKLSRGEVALGTNLLEVRDGSTIHALANDGMDFVLIDLEHCSQSMETVADLIAHSHAAGITPLVRIPSVDYAWITRTLDAGCQSILIPNVRSCDEVVAAVDMAHYPPKGHRGMALLGQASTNYEVVTDTADYLQWQNDNLLLGILIETQEAVDNLDDLLIDGVSFALSGPSDLAASLGMPGEVFNPRVVETGDRVRDACLSRGIFSAASPRKLDDISTAVAGGSRLIIYKSVLGLVRTGFAEVSAQVGRLPR